MHTKGEWVGKDRVVIAQCFTGEWKNIVDKVRGGNPVEADANTKLIAAAPDLLAALRGIFAERWGCPMCDSGVLRNPAKTHWPECPYAKAELAIAKAEGK